MDLTTLTAQADTERFPEPIIRLRRDDSGEHVGCFIFHGRTEEEGRQFVARLNLLLSDEFVRARNARRDSESEQEQEAVANEVHGENTNRKEPA